MFPLVSALTIVPVLFLGLSGQTSYGADAARRLLPRPRRHDVRGRRAASSTPGSRRRGAAWRSASSASAWAAPPSRAFTTVQLDDAHRPSAPVHCSSPSLLAVYARGRLRCCSGTRPAGRAPTGGCWRRLAGDAPAAGHLQLSVLYAVGFGGFVAFSVYLPTYLKTPTASTPGDAALRTAGFVVLAVVMRPVGGWLSDRFHPVPVLVACFAVVAVLRARCRRWSGRSRADGDRRVPRDGGRASAPASGAVFALVGAPPRPGKVGVGHRDRRRGRRARRLRPAAGHGRHLRLAGELQAGALAALRDRAGGRGLHRSGACARSAADPTRRAGMCDHCGCRDLTPVAAADGRARPAARAHRAHPRALAAGDDVAARAHLEEILVVLGPHVAKEEGVLFPMLAASERSGRPRARPRGRARRALRRRRRSGRRGCRRRGRTASCRLLHDLDEHMYKEDFGLFPAALATLDGSDWDAMDQWESARAGAPGVPLRP